MADREHQEQKAVFQWAAAAAVWNPELLWLHAIPNGGHRNIVTARKMKLEGVRKGVPDIFLDVPKGLYHGLRIEMKAPRLPGESEPRQSEEQTDWQIHYLSQGYRYEVCWGAKDAIKAIENYLSLPDPAFKRANGQTE